MQTYSDRLTVVRSLLLDPDARLSLKESFTVLYCWYRYEHALRKKCVAVRQMRRYADKLNADLDVFRLRKELNDL